MRYIGYPVFFSCLSILCFSCTSGSVQKPQPMRMSVQPDEVRQPDHEQLSLARKIETLIAELKETAAAHDIHNTFELFEHIAKMTAGNEQTALLADAYEAVKPMLNRLRLEPLTAPTAESAGKPFNHPFSVRLVSIDADQLTPVPLFPLSVSYPALDAAGNWITKTEMVTTDASGEVSVTPPVPAKPISSELVFRLKHSEAYPQFIAAEFPQAVFPFKAATTEKKIATIISILDFDQNNKPVFSNNITATRVLAGLMRRGFGRIGLDEYSELADEDPAKVINAAAARIGSIITRFIFGKTRIMVEQKADNVFACTIRADISVWNFQQAKITDHRVFEYTAEAKTKDLAISRARTTLGETIIADAVNYGF